VKRQSSVRSPDQLISVSSTGALVAKRGAKDRAG